MNIKTFEQDKKLVLDAVKEKAYIIKKKLQLGVIGHKNKYKEELITQEELDQSERQIWILIEESKVCKDCQISPERLKGILLELENEGQILIQGYPENPNNEFTLEEIHLCPDLQKEGFYTLKYFWNNKSCDTKKSETPKIIDGVLTYEGKKCFDLTSDQIVVCNELFKKELKSKTQTKIIEEAVYGYGEADNRNALKSLFHRTNEITRTYGIHVHFGMNQCYWD